MPKATNQLTSHQNTQQNISINFTKKIKRNKLKVIENKLKLRKDKQNQSYLIEAAEQHSKSINLSLASHKVRETLLV